MTIAPDWITRPDVQRVLSMLTDAGWRGLIVGGAVRDAVLGVAASDVDMATDAPPETVLALAQAAGLRAVGTGLEHGTVTVIAEGRPHEVTTFRRDVETDGRHATVAFSTDIAEDAARRDFTMNALYADARGQVLDPLGQGLADARARRVRFVGAPERRIREDYLRILRFFRFTACYGAPDAGPDAEGLAACAALAEGIDGLSRERIGQEMRKLLAARDPAPTLATMAAAGVLSHVLPGADPAALALLVHFEGAHPPRWLRRLATLGGGDPAESLRLSRAEARDLATLRRAALSTDDAATLGYRIGPDLAGDAILTRAALSALPPPDRWPDEAAFGAAQVFPVRAADLPPDLAGPQIGARLRALEARWIASGFALGRDALLNEA